MRKYYIIELTMVALVVWCISLNIKLNNTVTEVAILRDEVRIMGFDISEVDFRLTKMQKDKEDFNNLDFSEAFKVMYDKYGMHHLFEWRGRVYTTDLKEARNITITSKEKGASNAR
jgi:hypothetical protein